MQLLRYPGTYAVTVTNIIGCTATATTSVTVFGANPTIGSNTLCEGATLNLSAQNGGTVYAWSVQIRFLQLLINKV
ncbi:MAG: hypothetical protein U5N85_00210 [Arcicella sp.]|nr:hypothetical protein [Arcicella sp.]